MSVTIETIKSLRRQTGSGVMEVKRALQEAGGNVEEAKKILAARGLAKAQTKSERAAVDGLIAAYIHATGKIGAMIELFCETDFVARTDDFSHLAKELAMQIAATNPADQEELLPQEYIRDPSRTVQALISETIAKVGENIKVGRFIRFEM